MVINEDAFPEFQSDLNMTFSLSSNMPDRDQTGIIMSTELGDYSCDSEENVFAVDSLSRTQVMGNQFDIPSNGYSFAVHLYPLPLRFCYWEEESITRQSLLSLSEKQWRPLCA